MRLDAFIDRFFGIDIDHDLELCCCILSMTVTTNLQTHAQFDVEFMQCENGIEIAVPGTCPTPRYASTRDRMTTLDYDYK